MHITSALLAAFVAVTAAQEAPAYTNSAPAYQPPTYQPPTYQPPSYGSCEDRENVCRTGPNANQAQCSADRCACDGVPAYCHPTSSAPSYPYPTPSHAPNCEEQENACRTAPHANQAYCSSQRCACDGGKPYCHLSSSVPSYPTSSPPTPPPSSIPPYPTPSKAPSCDEQENACRTGPNANQAFCSSQRCSCDGAPAYCKSSTNSTVPVPPKYTPPTNGTIPVPPKSTPPTGGSTPVPPKNNPSPSSPGSGGSPPPPMYTGAADALELTLGAPGIGALAAFALFIV